MFRLTKRRKFILSSLILAFGLLAIQMGWIADRYLAIAVLCFLSVPLVFWSSRETLKGPIWLISWLLPCLFTAGVGLFYFLLPSSFVITIPVIIIYFFGMYALLLSENIFSVAAIRTIQLFRSASAVNFLLTLLTAFLLYDTVWSFRLPFYANAGLVFLISFLLFLGGVWSINLNEKLDKQILFYSLIPSLGIGEVAIILSFWPATITMASLFLTSLIYVNMGLIQAHLSGRLFERTVKEYLLAGFIVFIIFILYTITAG